MAIELTMRDVVTFIQHSHLVLAGELARLGISFEDQADRLEVVRQAAAEHGDEKTAWFLAELVNDVRTAGPPKLRLIDGGSSDELSPE